MNILYLGRSDTYLSHWYIQSLSKVTDGITVLNTNPNLIISEIPKFNGKIYNLYQNRKSFSNKFSDWLFFYPRLLLKSHKWFPYDKKTIVIIKNVIQDNKIDLIFAWWGADVLYELNLIFASRLKVKIIWALIVFPSALFNYGIIFEKMLAKKIISKVNGLVYGSELQKKYVRDNYKINDSTEEIVFIQSSKENVYFKNRLQKLSEKDGKFHIVFLGRTDFTKDPRRVKDDVRPVLRVLEHDDIVIHIARTTAKITNKNIEFFTHFSKEKLSSGEFSTYLTQFDACLVAYNYRDTKYHERFDTGISARMASAISAGIPIIIPAGTMKSCAKFVEKHSIGFTYQNINDLLSKLRSEEFSQITKNAEVKVFDFTFEKEFQKITQLIKMI